MNVMLFNTDAVPLCNAFTLWSFSFMT